MGESRMVQPPPKNVFALERTYLTWTHMAVTVCWTQDAELRLPFPPRAFINQGLTTTRGPII